VLVRHIAMKSGASRRGAPEACLLLLVPSCGGLSVRDGWLICRRARSALQRPLVLQACASVVGAAPRCDWLEDRSFAGCAAYFSVLGLRPQAQGFVLGCCAFRAASAAGLRRLAGPAYCFLFCLLCTALDRLGI